MKLEALAVSFVMCASLSGCMDPAQIRAEQHASDRERCTGYGYQPGTDAFADCMMRSDEKREYAEQRERQQADEKRQRDADRKARMRELALKRSGDERYPVCGATSPDAQLDMEGFWYGEGCRAR
jgi:hypothetical protein